MNTTIIPNIPTGSFGQPSPNAEVMHYMHQVAMLSMQLLQMQSKEKPWELLETSVRDNPCLQTAWTDFLMVLKLSDPEVSTRLDTITGNWAN